MAKKAKSGSARMREAGYAPVLLWLKSEQKKRLEEAAVVDTRPLTQFLLVAGEERAKKLLGKSSDTA